MAAKPDPLQLRKISDDRLAFVAGESDRFIVALNTVADELRGAAIDALSDVTTETAAKAKTLVDLQRELQAQLNRSSFAEKVRSFVGKYDNSQIFAIRTLEALGLKPSTLSPIDSNALEALKRHDYKFLTGMGPTTVQAVATGVVRNTLMGTSRAKVIDAIGATLNTRLRNQAAAYADTGLVSYDRRTSSTIWLRAGVLNYLYRGPKDLKNRPFCEHHVGKVYTLDQISGLDKELEQYSKTPLLPCLIYGGGWNCRHVWTPAI
jgi:hypothetical protein